MTCPTCQGNTPAKKWTRAHHSQAQRWLCRNPGCGRTFISVEDRQQTKQERFNRNLKRLVPFVALLALHFDTKQAERATGLNWDSASKTLKELAKTRGRFEQVMAEAEERLQLTQGEHLTKLLDEFAEWVDGLGNLLPDQKRFSQRKIRQMRQNPKGAERVVQLESDASRVTELDLEFDQIGRLRPRPQMGL